MTEHSQDSRRDHAQRKAGTFSHAAAVTPLAVAWTDELTGMGTVALAVLRGSFRAVVAIDDSQGRVVGFVNMISDGVLTAFIPWLEVLPEFQGHGIGTELMRRILDADQFYSIDLACDAPLLTYYSRFGMVPIRGAGLRRRAALEDWSQAGP